MTRISPELKEILDRTRHDERAEKRGKENVTLRAKKSISQHRESDESKRNKYDEKVSGIKLDETLAPKEEENTSDDYYPSFL